MNVFFVIDGKLVTPQLNGSILPGITRKTVLELAVRLGYETEERQIDIDELWDAANTGRVREVFGSEPGLRVIEADVRSDKTLARLRLIVTGQAPELPTEAESAPEVSQVAEREADNE